MTRQAPRVPMRTCIGCRKRRRKSELLRWVDGPEGIRTDPEQTRPGRGAYLCAALPCVDAAKRRGGSALRRALKGGDETEAIAVLDALATVLGEDQVPKGP